MCAILREGNKVLWKYSLQGVPFILKIPYITAQCGWEVCFSAFCPELLLAFSQHYLPQRQFDHTVATSQTR